MYFLFISSTSLRASSPRQRNAPSAEASTCRIFGAAIPLFPVELRILVDHYKMMIHQNPPPLPEQEFWDVLVRRIPQEEKSTWLEVLSCY